MLPSFPEFELLDLSHKELVRKMVVGFEPYSDFDFTSLFCWNTDNSAEISTINNNLVVRMPNYTTGHLLHTFIGKHKVDVSLNKLISKVGALELVPESVITEIVNRNLFTVIEDMDQHDYVYSLEDHAHLAGGKFKGKRKKMTKFINRFDSNISVSKINFAEHADCKEIKEVFVKWAKGKKKTLEDVQQESVVIDRFIKYSKNFNLLGLKLIANNKVVGFSIVEIVHGGYALYHFQKVLVSSGVGADIFLTSQTSKLLLDKGCKYINWEQDLGILGLRETKTNYKPLKMLKKYKVDKVLV